MSYLEINPVASLHFALNPFKFHVASHTTPVFFLPRSAVLMAEFGDLVFSPVVVPFLCFWIIGVVFIAVFSVPALFLWVTALFAFALVVGFTTFGSGVTMFCVVLWLESVVSAERPSVARRFGPGLGISADSGFPSFFFVDEGEEEEAATASEREEAVGIVKFWDFRGGGLP